MQRQILDESRKAADLHNKGELNTVWKKNANNISFGQAQASQRAWHPQRELLHLLWSYDVAIHALSVKLEMKYIEWEKMNRPLHGEVCDQLFRKQGLAQTKVS